MKIVEQSYEILYMQNNALSMMEVAGRCCYKSEDKIGCTTKNKDCHRFDPEEPCDWIGCHDHSSKKFIKMIMDKDHNAILEFGDITVRFVTNRGVTHELVRHRLFSFAQESTRYVRYDGQMEFIRPVWSSEVILGEYQKENIFSHLSKQAADNEFMFACEDAEKRYLKLLNMGWRPEQAREVLPNSLKTEIVVKGNIREWRHCLKLRTSKKAHPQIRALMLPLLAELQERVPVVFDDLDT